MYQAVYPTCLTNFLKTVSFVGIKFTFFGGSMVSGMVNETSFSGDMPYQYDRMGYTSSSVLVNSGDLIFFWLVLFLIYCVIYAIEFVLHSVPYIRTICERYRYNFFNAGMNFTFIKVAFDSSVGLLYLQMSNSDQIKSSVITLVFCGATICYPAYIAY